MNNKTVVTLRRKIIYFFVGLFISIGIAVVSWIIGFFIILFTSYGIDNNSVLPTLSFFSPAIIFAIGNTIALSYFKNKYMRLAIGISYVYIVLSIFFTLF